MKIIGIITRIISLQAFPVPVTHTWSLREGTTADGREKISGGGDYHYNDNVADDRMMMMKMVTIVIMLRMLFQIGMQGGAEARRCSCLEERGEVNFIINIARGTTDPWVDTITRVTLLLAILANR